MLIVHLPWREPRPRSARLLILLLLAATSPVACVRPPRTPVVAPAPKPAPAKPPATFIESTADSKTSRTFDVRDGWFKPALFSAATDALSKKFQVDVSDPHAGFIMTTWQASSINNGVPDLRYRTRIILRFIGDDWKQAKVKVEANWQHGDEWEIGYDAPLLDQVFTDLRAAIGKP